MSLSMELEITDSAREKIHQFISKAGADGKTLRLAVVRTHCMGSRGHGYNLQVAEEANADDTVVASNGLSLFVDPASRRLLEGVEIDYVEGFEANGFRVTNSHAIGKCLFGQHDLFN